MPKKVSENIDIASLLDMSERAMTQKEMAELTGVSIPTLAKRLDELKEKQGLLLRARDMRNLRLTELQMMVLDAVTPQKIEEAPLRDLVLAFKVLADRESVDIGKPTEVKGLVHYLVQIEKEKAAIAGVESVTSMKMLNDDDEVIDVEAELPNL